MANTKISALTALAGASVDTATDVLAIVDTSVTTTKKILIDELRIALGIATQAQQETGTSVVTTVTPGRQHFHQSAIKAWGYATYSGGTPTLAASYNISGIVDNGIGDIDFTISTDMSSGAFASGGCADDVNQGRFAQTFNNDNATFIRVLVSDSGASSVDPTMVSGWAYGDLS